MYTNHKLKHNLRRALAVPALILSFGAHAVAQEAIELPPVAPTPEASTQESTEDIHAVLQQIDARLSAAQEQALKVDEVKEAQKALEKQVNDLIIEENAALEALLEEHAEIQKELMEHPELQNPTAPPSEEVQERIQQYQALERQIGPARQVAFQAASVRDARDAFQKLLLEEMEKIDPETPELVEQGQALIAQLQEQQMQMQQQMQRMQQQQMQQSRPEAPASDAGPTRPEPQSAE